jgi:trehalose utilization protein
MNQTPIRVLVWNEFCCEKYKAACQALYPQGIHETIAAHLRREKNLTVRTATLEEPEHGLSEKALAQTDVLLWWAHSEHAAMQDEIVTRVHERVLQGMGLMLLHSAHYSKIFQRLMGTSCSLRWREAGEKERVWVVNPSHPIAQGLGPYFEVPQTEMYGEVFDVPPPEELIFLSWYQGGEVFRSGATWTRGLGKIFYFAPGHETYPIYYQPEILKVISNGVNWLAFRGNTSVQPYLSARVEPLEPLSND